MTRNGNVLTSNRGTGATAINWSYAYDELNNLTSEALDVDGRQYNTNYTYDLSAFLTSTNLPSGRLVSYTNDGLGRNTALSSPGVSAANISYHPSGALSTLDYGNGQAFSQTLNARLLPEHLLSQLNPTNKALDLTYGYDARGKVTQLPMG